MEKDTHLNIVAVIGGGPAGLFAAIAASENSQVIVLEKKHRPGLKLLLSGSGQCNLTHSGSVEEFLLHYGKNGRFLKSALYAYPPEKLIDFFRSRGVPVSLNGKGKFFPDSGKASDILNCLLSECRAKGVDIRTGCPVSEISSRDGLFVVRYSGDALLTADKVIISTGGMTYPKTGSSGDGYSLVQSLGHSLIDPRPALTNINVLTPLLSHLSGISFPEINMKLYRGGKKIMDVSGDMVITHTGFSGPVVLDNSRYILPGDDISFDFTGCGGQFPDLLDREILRGGKKKISTILHDLGIPRNLAETGLKILALDTERKGAETGRKERSLCCDFFTGQKFTVSSTGGMESAMVTAGGIPLNEVSSGTLESRRVSGLFFAGEVLDIDGDTGGYNLQAAFSTGYLAGSSAF